MGIVDWVEKNKPLVAASGVAFFFFLLTIIYIGKYSSTMSDFEDYKQLHEHEIVTFKHPPVVTPPTKAPPRAKPEDMSKYRLPGDVRPNNYDLYLRPDVEYKTKEFEGKITINVTIVKDTRSIVMHCEELVIRTIKLNGKAASYKMDVKHQMLTIMERNLEILPKGTAIIYVDYIGMMSKLTGFYLSTYRLGPERRAQQRALATTKFEPTFARQAFPCFDEPDMKATFRIRLWKPANESYVALSNYPEIRKTVQPDGVITYFGQTVPMSTYLACFIVCDFEHSKTTIYADQKMLPIRIFTQPGQLNKTAYAQETAAKAMNYFISYLAIPYHLPKLDLIAIPQHYPNAMENWGLITFKDAALLFDPNRHSAKVQQKINLLISHELAHNWFGNLVTMKWWNDLWLNEGFARYMQYKGGMATEPDFNYEEQFAVEVLHSALYQDAAIDSRPIAEQVHTPDEIMDLFDPISYDKGASILRMIENVIGQANFTNVTRNYLKRHQFGNVVTGDFVKEIEKLEVNFNVSEFVRTFTEQPGYPVLKLYIKGNNYTVKQERFLLNPDRKKQANSTAKYKWMIPLRYTTDLGPSPKIVWFNSSRDSALIWRPRAATWIKINSNQTGYYIVNYPESIWKQWGKMMMNLSSSDRANLIGDAFKLARAGQLDYTIVLDMTKYLINETSYAPWYVAAQEFKIFINFMKASPYVEHLKKFVIALALPTYQRFNWRSHEGLSHIDRLLRMVIFDLVCAMDYYRALYDASTELTKLLKDNSSSPDLRQIACTYGMRYNSHAKWDQLIVRLASEQDPIEQLNEVRGLAGTFDPALLNRLIRAVVDDGFIPLGEFDELAEIMSNTDAGMPVIWDYVRENWNHLVDIYSLYSRTLHHGIFSITTKFITEVKLGEVMSFFDSNPAGAGLLIRKQIIEIITDNIKWVKKHSDKVNKWMKMNIIRNFDLPPSKDNLPFPPLIDD